MTEKNGFSLSTAYQNPAGRKVYGWAAPGFFSLTFGPRAAKVGVGASPQKAFGCQRQAKRSACPTRGWVKSSPHHCRSLSALRGDVVWFFPLFLSSLGNGPRASDPFSTKARTAPQIRPTPARRDRDSAPPQRRAHSPSHGQTGGERTGGQRQREKMFFLCIAYQELTCDKGCSPCSFRQSARGPRKVDKASARKKRLASHIRKPNTLLYY